mmetsp:Transcript_45833/g.55145  ORF Transcript_45833/g.55145 Transcript_45833/m.55145 type:complete len:227 (+) Transcript_45833:134-814(+)|eukprot:CAMPEP_0194394206 /NCGR_PEP_ID=MMETSP0174-20130528/123727_1 /TAXON_ID=216777 /ORGANISM="Proboscia alata, Strain PI-D3" /LENGTH=226 /DNA_ID=CAMNT_0039189983 /DNA_START=92 /DNA_END=772 /DNA_ORIENTATION=-
MRAYLLFTLLLTPLAVFAGSNPESLLWLEKNSKEEGVITLSSGLQYKVLRKGSGVSHPTVDSSCECHYEGKLIDGTKFDSSYDRGSPTSFAPNQVIKGWTEAMQLMVEGDKWEMYIPSELGYGDGGSPPKIGGGDALVFVMEIIKIQGNKVPAVTCEPATLEGCNDREKGYVEKVQKKYLGDIDELSEEINRIKRVTEKVEEAKLLEWAGRRIHILNKLKPSEDEF